MVPILVGRNLGHYAIREPIGAGRMGVVYRAWDERLQREVALKVLPEGLLADETARRRFRRGALALSRLNHPNVATVHDFDRADDVDFLVMELVPGQSLEERLAEDGPASNAEILRLGAQLAAGLAAAHAEGVVHRDLKPANVRITPDGRLKIVDFGLAQVSGPRSTSGVTSAGEIPGTLVYMAPEQLRGERADARTDLYAVGATLYEMASGRRLVTETNPARAIYEILNVPPPDVRTLRPDLDEDLARLIMRAVEKDPGLRPASAGELLARIEALGAPAAARPRRLPRPRWPAAAGVGAVLIALALAPPLCRRVAGPMDRIASLAVLPLENLSRDPDQEYFADGMTDELITELAQIGAFRVISRTSVMPFKGTRRTLRQIAQTLRVDAIVEGTVLRVGDRVRISAQLIRVATDQNLWAARYERDLKDVLALQSEVAQAVVRGVRAAVTPQQKSRLASPAVVNPEAYQAYLRGRYSFNQFSQAGFRRSIADYTEALRIDSTYAPAWAGLAMGYYGLSNIYLSPAEAMPRSRAAALRAIALDASCAEAHCALGIEKTVYEWDWAGADREFKRSLEINPGDAATHLWYAQYLVTQGLREETISEDRRSLELNPIDLISSATAGWHLFYLRDYPRAVEQLRATLSMDSTFYLAHAYLGMTELAMNRPTEAAAELERARALDDNSEDTAQLACAYARLGKRAEALRLMAELDRRARAKEFVSPYDLALVHAALGERSKALDLLERAAGDRAELLIYLKVDPLVDPLRSEPRFRALLQRMGLG